MILRLFGLLILVCLGIAAVVFNQQIMSFSDEYLTDRNGREAMMAKNWSHALTLYEAGVQNHPHNVAFAQNLATLYAKTGKRKKAQALYAKLLKDDPDNTPLRLDYARFLAKDPARLNQALDLIQGRFKYFVEDPAVLSTLGYIYKQAASDAREKRKPIIHWLEDWSTYFYRHSLKLDPEQFHPYAHLGMLAYRQNDPQKAVLNYCNALTINPNSYEVRYNLGVALTGMKAYGLAYQQFGVVTQGLSDEGRMTELQKVQKDIEVVKRFVEEDKEGGGLAPPDIPNEFEDCLSG